jgi:DNA-binding SARP family transcriptional activator
MIRPDLLPPVRPGTLPRPRLVERLSGRFDVSLTVVLGGGGVGKTTVLAQALADGTDHHDVWVSATPADDAASLWRRVLAGLGHPVQGGATRAELVEAIVAEAPTRVCVVVDDAHRLADDGPLVDLLDHLPRNGHLLVASRRRPALGLARRRAAGSLLEVGQGELLLTDDELLAWSHLRKVDAVALAGAEGWPALVELATRAARGGDPTGDVTRAGRAYLEEEAVAALGPERLQALARFAAVGGGDDLVARAVTGWGLEELIDDLPLIAGDPAGVARPHDLWAELLDGHLSAGDRREAAVAAAAVLRGRAELERAIELVAGVGAVDELIELVREACLTILDGGLAPDRLDRWSALLSDTETDQGIVHLVRGLSAREHDPASATCWDALVAAAEALGGEGDDEAEVAALAQLGYLAQITGREQELPDLFERLQQLAADGSTAAEPFVALGVAWAHFGRHEPAAQLGAVQGLDDAALPESWRLVRDYLWANALYQLGRPEEALARVPQALRDRTIALPGALPLEDQARWLAGHPEDVLAGGIRGTGPEYGARDRYLAAAFSAVFDTYAGRVEEAEAALAAARAAAGADPGPQVAFQLEALAAPLHLVRGEEGRAAETLRGLFASAPLELAAVRGTFTPHLAMVYVLVPESRPVWDGQELGPAFAAARALARALVAHREQGDLAAVRLLDWPAPGRIAAALPVPLLVELALAGEAAGVPAARATATWAVEHWRGPAREQLRRHAAGDGPLAVPAATLLTELPVPPDQPVEISVLGPLALSHGGHASSSAHWRRERVRSLLLYLVLHGPTSRERLGDELWPGLEPKKADKNLRTTLSYLHQVLEPTRAAGDAPWYVRDEHGLLALHESADVDLWAFDRDLNRAAELDRAGAPTEALRHLLVAVARWRGELASGDADHAWADLERTRVHSRLVRAAVRAADLLVATGRPEDAVDACHLAIEVDRWHEPAYRTLAQAYVELGDVTAARATLRTAQAALDEIGIEVAAGS